MAVTARLIVPLAAVTLAGCSDLCDDRVMGTPGGMAGQDFVLVERNCGATADLAYHLRPVGEEEAVLVYERTGSPDIRLDRGDDGTITVSSIDPIRVFRNDADFIIANEATR